MLEKDLPIITTTYNQLNSYVYKRDGQHFKPFGQDGMTFLDFLDIINPLQHIPLVSTIYRKITGDTIDPASRIAGKPTEIMFNEGAARVIIPRPAFTNKTEIINGRARTNPPMKRRGVQLIKISYTEFRVKA